jgi:GT2 family glycosyltransferase
LKKTIILGVAFNNPQDIKTFISSIALSELKFDPLIVILDNTEDLDIAKLIENETINISRETNLNIIYDKLSVNKGYFGALNYGINKYANNFYFTIICNLDIIFVSDFFINLYDKKYNDDFLAIVPGVKTLDGFDQNPHITNFTIFRFFQFLIFFSNYYVGLFLKFLKNKRKNIKRNSSLDINKPWSGIGCCYILTQNFFRYFDKLNYTYFLFSEELYFTHQIYEINKKIYFDPSLKLVHKESSSTKTKSNRYIYNLAKKPTIHSYFLLLKLNFKLYFRK